MPTITVALDSSRRRDLKLQGGDQVQIDVVVYAKNGDPTPLTVTDLRMSSQPYWGSASFPIGSLFTVSNEYPGRRAYRITGVIAGARTTLAYGVLETFGECYNDVWPMGNDYGWRYGWGWPL